MREDGGTEGKGERRKKNIFFIEKKQEQSLKCDEKTGGKSDRRCWKRRKEKVSEDCSRQHQSQE
jgi:hypothetical protein